MDKIIRCITGDGSIIASAIDSSDIVAAAQQVHKLSPIATAALGRLLTGASLMGAQLKQKRAALTLRIKSDGELGIASATSDGNVRGFVQNPNCKTEYHSNGKLNVGKAVGKNGYLYVIRDYGTGQPYNGVVELVSGEIAEDITAYYANSEQIPTVCALGVLVAKDDGGAMMALDGFNVEVLEERPVHYYCTCSKQRVEQSFATLTDDQLRGLVNSKGKVEAICHYCNKHYLFDKKEIDNIIEKRKSKK